MDLDNLLSGYLSGLVSMVIYVQWSQVYKVISNPEEADQTLIRNWAQKTECFFVCLLSIIMIAGLYFCMWDHYNEHDEQAVRVAKIVFQTINEVIRIAVIGLYIGLFCLFLNLMRAENEYL